VKISEPAEEILEKIYVFLEENDVELILLEMDLYDKKAVKELEDLKLIEYKGNNVQLTSEGFEEAKKVIRRHRLAEKLLHDVLGLTGEDMETAACNFEHIMEGEVEESICTLLSHPKVCPHGKPIPPCKCSKGGMCKCTAEVKEIIKKTVLPLTKLNKGQIGKIVYIKSAKRDNLHKILSIGVLPGREIKVVQNYPSHVFQMEHTQIAVDSEIAESIFVGSLNKV
jgi:DtxR family Mn-dependent transcriptional regulator